MNPYSCENYQRTTDLSSPNGSKNIVLHSCCAPCAGEVMEALNAAGYQQLIFFYNPNIHPSKEYQIRKDENKRFCDKLNIPFVDADYDKENWFDRIKGLEWEPERGKRCGECFSMRFERTALYAQENGYNLISSTLGISRWKDMNQINQAGIQASERFPNISYWTYNWRKFGGSARMVEIAKREQFYQQEYCGCVYSLRDTNAYRISRNRPVIRRGIKFYGKEGID